VSLRPVTTTLLNGTNITTPTVLSNVSTAVEVLDVLIGTDDYKLTGVQKLKMIVGYENP
jgi:hypothetical protein